MSEKKINFTKYLSNIGNARVISLLNRDILVKISPRYIRGLCFAAVTVTHAWTHIKVGL